MNAASNVASHLALPITLGRYHLQAEIASGGVATVYIGRMVGRAGFERRVAVKVLHKHLSTDPEFVAMFLDEARLSARIHHQNVVDVYDVDAVDGELIMVMEYVEGAPLSFLTRLARQQGAPIEVHVVGRIMHDALQGLHAAHELVGDDGRAVGLVHRDISPQNILVGADGITRVADFGIAKAAGRIANTRGTDTVKGKLRYLAPEQVHQNVIDRRTDVFTSGIVLWETLTGRQLFDGQTDGEIIGQVVMRAIVPPSSIRPGIDPALDAVCLRALERDASQRYPTAEAFADALEAAVPALAKPREVGAFVSQQAHVSIARGRDAMRSVAEIPTDAEAASAALFAPTGTDSGVSGRAPITTTTGHSATALRGGGTAPWMIGVTIVSLLGLAATGAWFVTRGSPSESSGTASSGPSDTATPPVATATTAAPSAPISSGVASASAGADAMPSAMKPTSTAAPSASPTVSRPPPPKSGTWVPLQP